MGCVCHDPRLPGHVCPGPQTIAAGLRGMGATTPVLQGMCATTPKRAMPPGACPQQRRGWASQPCRGMRHMELAEASGCRRAET